MMVVRDVGRGVILQKLIFKNTGSEGKIKILKLRIDTAIILIS